MWRYAPVLPAEASEAVSLDEGLTPLLRTTRLGGALGLSDLWVKDEGRNPTGSLHDRGMSCVVTVAKQRGLRQLILGSEGNAATGLAAYAALAGIRARVFVPPGASANFIECKAYGADVTPAPSTDDCERIAVGRKATYTETEAIVNVDRRYLAARVEGLKTIGYEIAEQLDWALPDTILCPCGHGLTFFACWKAFLELSQLGWIAGKRPRMIAVQSDGCQPIVRAWEQNCTVAETSMQPHTIDAGLRVPKPVLDVLVLHAIRESGGAAVSVSDQEMLDCCNLAASKEGILPGLGGGACIAAAQHLLTRGFLKQNEKIVFLNPASGLKQLEAYSVRFPRYSETEQDKLGGLITPR